MHGVARLARALTETELLDHVGAIYDCVVDPARWEPTLLCLARDLDLANAIISAISLHDGRTLINVVAGVPAEFAATAANYGEDVLAIWGGAERMAALAQREPYVQSEITDRTSWSRLALYTDWMAPQGIVDTLAIGLNRDGVIANIAFGRHASAGPIGEAELDALRVLAPHFARAFEVMALVDHNAARTAAAASILDVARCAVVVVDAEAKIVFANRRAEAMFARRDLTRSESNRLRMLVDPGPSTALERAIETTLSQPLRLTGVIGVPGRRRDGTRIAAYVTPLRRQGRRPQLVEPDTAAAAIFIAEAATTPQSVSQTAALLFELTPAEVSVMERVADGLAIGAVAATLGVTVATAKSHLQHVFEKTGCHRQAELVALAASLRPPL